MDVQNRGGRTDGQTDGQIDSSIPPPPKKKKKYSFGVGITTLVRLKDTVVYKAIRRMQVFAKRLTSH